MDKDIKVFLLCRPIVLMEVPKEKKEILETVIRRDTCGYGIYPGLHPLEKAGAGTDAVTIHRSRRGRQIILVRSFSRREGGGGTLVYRHCCPGQVSTPWRRLAQVQSL